MTRRNSIDITHEAILAALEEGPKSVAELSLATGYGKGKIDYSLRILLAMDEAHWCGLQPSESKGQRRKVYAWGPNPNPAPKPEEVEEVTESPPVPRLELHPMMAWGIAA